MSNEDLRRMLLKQLTPALPTLSLLAGVVVCYPALENSGVLFQNPAIGEPRAADQVSEDFFAWVIPTNSTWENTTENPAMIPGIVASLR